MHIELLNAPSTKPSSQEQGTAFSPPNPFQEGNLSTRSNLIQTFERVAQSAKSTDILLVYLAGHGLSGPNDDYYYLTADAYTDDLADPAVRAQTAISGEELTELIRQIPALKQALILDTCASGRMVRKLTAQRTIQSSQIRVLERMKDRMGLHILAGSAADAFSYETSRYGQGLLTYSLLFGIHGAALDREGFIDISKLFLHARKLVPRLAKDIGRIQEPRIYGEANFWIGQVTDEDKPQIPVAKVLPVVLRANFQDEDVPLDQLGLTRRINDVLWELSEQGREAPLTFFDIETSPDAYLVTGRYQIEGDRIAINVYLYYMGKVEGQIEKIAEFPPLEGEKSNLNQLAKNIVTMIQQKIVQGLQ